MNIKNNIYDDAFSTSPSISCAPSTVKSSHPSEREEESEDGEDGEDERRCHGKLCAKTFESGMEVEEVEVEVEEEEEEEEEEKEEEREEEEEKETGRWSCMVKQQEGGENPENDDLEYSHIKVRKMKGLEVVPKAISTTVYIDLGVTSPLYSHIIKHITSSSSSKLSTSRLDQVLIVYKKNVHILLMVVCQDSCLFLLRCSEL